MLLRITLIVGLLVGVSSLTCNNFRHSTENHDDHEEEGHEDHEEEGEDHEEHDDHEICANNSTAVGTFTGTLGEGPYKCAHFTMTYTEDGTTHTKAGGGCIPAFWDCPHIQELTEAELGIEDHEGHDHARTLETTMGTYSCAVCETDECNAASVDAINPVQFNAGNTAQVSLFAASAALIVVLTLAMK
jgi:hypothetical protein